MAAKTKRSAAKTPAIGGGMRARWFTVAAALLAALGAVGYRCYELHLKPDPRLDAIDARHWGRQSITRPRGEIRDVNGFKLATNRQTPSVWADPSRIDDPRAMARELAGRLDLTEAELYDKLTLKQPDGSPMKFVWLKRWLEPTERTRLGPAEELPKHVNIAEESLRYYPEDDLAADLVGYANRSGEGQAGAELYLEEQLSSTPGSRRARVDVRRRMIESLAYEFEPPTGGNHVTLTIDKATQHALERELAAACERLEAPGGMGMVMDPDTGAVRAMAEWPAYNPNRYNEYPLERLTNRMLVHTFEPGSAFKIVMAAAALEEGLVTPDTKIDCENGRYNPFGRRIINDFHKLETVPFTEAFAESSNIALVKLAEQLGPEKLSAWIQAFGFGRATSSDFPYESAGIFTSNTAAWSGYSITSLPIGQEISVTLPQLARAFCVVANGGYLVEPYYIQRVISPEGQVLEEREPQRGPRVLSRQTAATMQELCYLVVTHGTGDAAAIREYRAGGKTGTAQIAKQGGGGYADKKYTAVFAGFAPVADPELCCVVVIEEPKYGSHYGSKAAAPVFQKVVREALLRMNVPKDPMLVELDEPTPELADADTVMQHLALDPLEPDFDLELDPAAEDSMKAAARMPDLSGLTKREVLGELRRLGLGWQFEGAGWVVAQKPRPGETLDGPGPVRLTFDNYRDDNHDET